MASNLSVNEICHDRNEVIAVNDDDDYFYRPVGSARREERRREIKFEPDQVSPFFPLASRKRSYNDLDSCMSGDVVGGVDGKGEKDRRTASAETFGGTTGFRVQQTIATTGDLSREASSTLAASPNSNPSSSSQSPSSTKLASLTREDRSPQATSSAPSPYPPTSMASASVPPTTSSASTPSTTSSAPTTPTALITSTTAATEGRASPDFCPTSLAFMCFKDDVVEALRRLPHLENREKELTQKLKTAAEALAASEEKRAALSLALQGKEGEVKDTARKFEREFCFKLEDDKIKMRKMSLALNATSKSRDAIKSELESLKVSFQELTVSSSDVESKLKTATRLKEIQTKRIEALESAKERLTTSVERRKLEEKGIIAQMETMGKRVESRQADLDAQKKIAVEWKFQADEHRSKVAELEEELRQTRRRLDEALRKEKRDEELRAKETESRRSEQQKHKTIIEGREKEAEETRSRLDALAKTVEIMSNSRQELNRSVEEARTTRVQMERDLREAGRKAEAAEADAAMKGAELEKIRERHAQETKGSILSL